MGFEKDKPPVPSRSAVRSTNRVLFFRADTFVSPRSGWAMQVLPWEWVRPLRVLQLCARRLFM